MYYIRGLGKVWDGTGFRGVGRAGRMVFVLFLASLAFYFMFGEFFGFGFYERYLFIGSIFSV